MDPTEFGRKMNVEDLIAVHLTRYFPKEGIIRTLNSNYPELTLRNTVHFAINHPVGNAEMYGNWDGASYAILAPLGNLSKEEGNLIWNFNVVDTYFLGDVKLPKGSTIIVSPYAYNDLIEKGVVERDTLMSKFADERSPSKPEDYLVVKKEGIRYVILSPNSRDLRTEVYAEIERQGYECMPRGQWNWGGAWGAEEKDQERIAQKVGAIKTGKHCDDPLHLLEGLSHMLVNLSSINHGRRSIDAYLEARKYGLSEYEGQWESEVFFGRSILSSGEDGDSLSIPLLFNRIEAQREKLPKDYQHRVDLFLTSNRRRFREFIPPEVIQEFALPI